jgi:uncharacterized protein (TIGR03435 family)
MTRATIAVVAVPIAIGLLNVPHGQAQSQPATTRPEFEVASIKLNKSGELSAELGPIGDGRFSTTNLPLRDLITLAYRLQEFQLSGEPGWLRSERYDIQAKAEAKAGSDDLTAMLQPLFEDRLQLKYHWETRELPVYALVVAKPGRLHEAKGGCDPPPSGPPALPSPNTMPHGPCGRLFFPPWRLVGQHVAISQDGTRPGRSLVDALSRVTGRIVRDKTGLTGKYDIDLNYTPEFARSQPPPGGAGPEAPTGLPPLPPIDPNGPSLVTALQEQLGLKLESQKGPVQIMVIDHIEKPSEN